MSKFYCIPCVCLIRVYCIRMHFVLNDAMKSSKESGGEKKERKPSRSRFLTKTIVWCKVGMVHVQLCRAETENMLIEARHQQIQHKDHFLAVEAQRDREEFNRVLK